jgi:hypothetical protein
VVERRRRQVQRTINQQLPEGGKQQILSTNNFCYLHGRIVNDHSELISRQIVSPPDDEVTKVFSRDRVLGTETSNSIFTLSGTRKRQFTGGFVTAELDVKQLLLHFPADKCQDKGVPRFRRAARVPLQAHLCASIGKDK